MMAWQLSKHSLLADSTMKITNLTNTLTKNYTETGLVEFLYCTESRGEQNHKASQLSNVKNVELN